MTSSFEFTRMTRKGRSSGSMWGASAGTYTIPFNSEIIAATSNSATSILSWPLKKAGCSYASDRWTVGSLTGGWHTTNTSIFNSLRKVSGSSSVARRPMLAAPRIEGSPTAPDCGINTVGRWGYGGAFRPLHDSHRREQSHIEIDRGSRCALIDD